MKTAPRFMWTKTGLRPAEEGSGAARYVAETDHAALEKAHAELQTLYATLVKTVSVPFAPMVGDHRLIARSLFNRVSRYTRLLDLESPAMLLEAERRLIETAFRSLPVNAEAAKQLDAAKEQEAKAGES